MSDHEAGELELAALITAGARPATSPLRRAVQRLWLRAARPQVAHQRQLDGRLFELLRAQREAAARSESALAELRAVLSAVSGELTAQREELGGLRSWCAEIGGEVGGAREWIASIDADLERDRRALARELEALSRRVPDAVALDGSHALTLERFDAGLGGEVVGFRDGGSDADAGVYVGFEDFFRGAEDVIRERQLAYMPLLDRHGPVLDIGCGRGEMLELLRDRGIEAAGIDIDPAMIERCRQKGLGQVQVADGVSYLEDAPAGSLGAVFAAQVIEHLPYTALVQFLRAARRALAPAGLLVVETVNPHAPQALKHFWIDPTHQHPLYPEVVLALCRLTGFASGYVWHPQGSGDPDRDRIEQLDYAVVAETGASGADTG